MFEDEAFEYRLTVIAASYGFFGRESMIQREDENTDAGRADLAVNRLAFSIYGNVTGPLVWLQSRGGVNEFY
jgi:hypothetical protein